MRHYFWEISASSNSFSEFRVKPGPSQDEEPEETKEQEIFIRDLFFEVDITINLFFLGGRALLFLVLFIGGWKLIFSPVKSNYVATSYWHLVNLPFHEAGHIIFRPFGRVMTSLGRSLSQLMMPLICLGVFIIMQRKRLPRRAACGGLEGIFWALPLITTMQGHWHCRFWAAIPGVRCHTASTTGSLLSKNWACSVVITSWRKLRTKWIFSSYWPPCYRRGTSSTNSLETSFCRLKIEKRLIFYGIFIKCSSFVADD